MRKTSKDFFESISQFQHTIGIYLTFTLDNRVIKKLIDNSSGTILILHDYTQGVCLKNNQDSKVVCIPVNSHKLSDSTCFHSKLALLKSEDKIKVIFGSFNLSQNSFRQEKEIALEMELSFSDPLIESIIKYLRSLVHYAPSLPTSNLLSDALDKITIISDKLQSSGNTAAEFVYTSESDSIFYCLKRFLNNNKLSNKPAIIKIVTPFVSKDYKNYFEELSGLGNSISVYLRNGGNIHPFQKSSQIFQPVKGKRRENFHAKIVLLEYEKDSVLFIGSANFTEQGFFKSLIEGANHECGLILKVSRDEMSQWFDSKLWEQLKEAEFGNYTVSDSDFINEKGSNFYAWAEIIDSEITTFFYLPKIGTKVFDTNNKPIQLEPIEESGNLFFKTTQLKPSKETPDVIKFIIDDEKEPVEVAIFNCKDFDEISKGLGYNPYLYVKGIHSLDVSEVREAIKFGKIHHKVSAVIIKEPPALEQYFYNVKETVRFYERQKYFSDYDKKMLEKRLGKFESAESLYLSIQLYKTFSKIKLKKPNLFVDDFINICKNRIDVLTNIIGINKKQMENFLEIWKQ